MGPSRSDQDSRNHHDRTRLDKIAVKWEMSEVWLLQSWRLLESLKLHKKVMFILVW